MVAYIFQDKLAQLAGEPPALNDIPKHNQTLMVRILGPILTFVDRPWKVWNPEPPTYEVDRLFHQQMYPVGVLFGFGESIISRIQSATGWSAPLNGSFAGFDTASSIALLGISAIAKRDVFGKSIPSSHIVILPVGLPLLCVLDQRWLGNKLLFTAGMSMIDSADSILMLYSYTGFPERSWAILRRYSPEASQNPGAEKSKDETQEKEDPKAVDRPADTENLSDGAAPEVEERIQKDRKVKMNVMSTLSIILTLLSILVAYT
jgi:high-affinity nickel-transport protein